ncbi:MAG: hypothetical protein PX481_16560 [Microcystis sp. M53603_WE2]|jgi:hypothetical protein|uniref:Uncharacterized protein n=1 Tax=Microcystis aeruginosa Ma_OC_H_19870700_S124 TaxID=2486262 RepID=A0A552AR51_MICAE|nr:MULTISPECIES: hypothetical protein [unclassified Microcystis]MCZ8040531.1 hypothetical protein [Microcystis sp. LE17-20A]MCZ8213575.1 hypothetical protein [Microcystis sp. LE19-8.1F]MDJ0540257.1 hypothetical protein [Microcystis sp. M53603_WE2]TRT87945.1 MAG: hypothetical protein EWV63_07270 [Microcystis aeruginosa Ma_OC_H_19870700_S124]
MPRFVKQAYMQRLTETGQETKTSYWIERGDGMLLFKTDSLEAAESIIGQHPLIENGCVEY